MKRRSLLKFLGLLWPATGTLAQSASGKPIRIIVPLSTGTPSDAVTRVIAPNLSAILNQPIVVDNKPGASGVLAVQELLRSPPDGNTLLMGTVSPLAINMAIVKNLPYDPRRDFTPVAAFYVGNHVWAVNATLPVRTMAEFIAYAKQRPGKVSAGHSTALQKIQLAAIEKMAGIELLQVPYKATSTTITDTMGGTLDMTLLDMGTALSMAKSSQIRLLAVSTLKRNPLSPDWPAVSETVPGFNFGAWAAFMGPAGMPVEVVTRLNTAVAQALKQKDVAEKFAVAGGVVPLVMSPEQLKAHIQAEVTKWTEFARLAKIDPE